MCIFFFFNDPATTEIYTLSLHDALPISPCSTPPSPPSAIRASLAASTCFWLPSTASSRLMRSEEHTSELQSHHDLVCRLLLEKKKTAKHIPSTRKTTLASLSITFLPQAL